MKTGYLLSAAVLLGVLAGCGSDSDDDDPIVINIPADNGSQPEPEPEPTPEPEPEPEPEVPVAGPFECPETGLYFCDDFASGELSNWNVLASPDNTTGATGTFDILDDNGNNVLRYTAATAGPNKVDGELLLVTPEAFADVPNADYFVEARIRPRQNSNTASKFLYMMARYDSAGNWHAGGLNVQNSSSSTKVEIAKSVDGSISRPVQASKPILLGEAGETDGVWYTVRFEMIGEDLTVYLNGELLGTTPDADYADKGLIGLYTYNRSFEIDDIKVGDPAVKPVQLTIDYADPTWEVEAGSAPLVVTVAALQDDGVTEDSFTVESSDPAIVAVDIDGAAVSLTPLAKGDASVTFTSGSDPSIERRIDVAVAEGFTMPSTTYGDLDGKLMPASRAMDVHIDEGLAITFDSAPTLGDIGSVRIFRASDNALIDTINLGAEVDNIGYPGQDRVRSVYYSPFVIDGNTLHIKPHTGLLEYGTDYYVAIGDGVVVADLNGMSFSGLGENSNWSFSTKAAAPTGNEVTVDDDGAADFRTVQGALNYMMSSVPKDDAALVHINDGSYHEMLFLRNKNNLTLRGESSDNTVIHYDNYESLNGGSGGSAAPGPGTPGGGRSVFLVEGVDNLVLDTITLKNDHIRVDNASNQAETIYFNSSYRLIAKNSAFISEQDTLLLKGYTWFYNTLVAGNVDFIWGYSVASLFEDSEIRSIGDSKGSSDGYILQARTENITDPGFVFLNSRLTRGAGPTGNVIADGTSYLARSGGKAENYDNIAFINCAMDSHIADIGWAGEGVNSQPAPNPVVADASSGWKEFGSTDLSGNPLDLSQRESGYLLSAGEAAAYSDRASVFAGYNGGAGWNPEP
ncbi:pectinesterase family protein [uncultured Gilvimarinus sp.]|uniref:pectinesterase family protein n=1 Tax=uncultured Gilvimarinus sp. TaxID=1689143 RepID=UPI0030D96E9F